MKIVYYRVWKTIDDVQQKLLKLCYFQQDLWFKFNGKVFSVKAAIKPSMQQYLNIIKLYCTQF